MILRYPKGTETFVSQHFRAREFDCQCRRPTCTETLIESELLSRLEAFHGKVGAAVTITSGYRCPAHCQDLEDEGYETAGKKSQHGLGRAADLTAGKLPGAVLEAHARAAGFRAVGVGKTFIHADLRDDMDRRWFYRLRHP